MNIGKALKELRKEKEVRQTVAAVAIGMTQTYLSQIEAGKKNPSTELINKMGNYYQVPIAIVLWKAIEETDVREDKRNAFNQIKPIIDNLITQIL